MATIDTISHAGTALGNRAGVIVTGMIASVTPWRGRHAHKRRPAQSGQPGFWVQFFEVWRSRRALAALDERLLRDIGITRNQALQEADRWRWDRQW